jgi:hypothetical protein
MIAEWERFLSGHWTREKPTKPGVYIVEGVQCGEPQGVSLTKTLIVVEHEGRLISTHTWGGWRWSEPAPYLPPTPDASEEEKV